MFDGAELAQCHHTRGFINAQREDHRAVCGTPFGNTIIVVQQDIAARGHVAQARGCAVGIAQFVVPSVCHHCSVHQRQARCTVSTKLNLEDALKGTCGRHLVGAVAIGCARISLCQQRCVLALCAHHRHVITKGDQSAQIKCLVRLVQIPVDGGGHHADGSCCQQLGFIQTTVHTVGCSMFDGAELAQCHHTRGFINAQREDHRAVCGTPFGNAIVVVQPDVAARGCIGQTRRDSVGIAQRVVPPVCHHCSVHQRQAGCTVSTKLNFEDALKCTCGRDLVGAVAIGCARVGLGQ